VLKVPFNPNQEIVSEKWSVHEANIVGHSS